MLGTNSSTPPDGGVYVTENALAAAPTFTRTLALGSATAVSDSNIGRAELAISKPGAAPVATVYVASGESSGAPACGTGGTLRRSDDGGATWSLPLPSASGFCAAQCFYDIALAVDPTNALGVLLGGNVTGATCTRLIARSTDGGLTFINSNVGIHPDNQVVVFAPSDSSVAYMGTDGGIYRSADGGNTWEPQNNTTFRATQFQSIATHPTDREIMLGGTQDNGTIKRNPDGSWTRTNSGDGGYTLFDRSTTGTNNAIAFQTTQAATGSIAFGRSLNSGSSFTRRNCPANGIDCTDSVLFYPPVALGPDTADSPNSQNTFYYGTDRLYRSADGLTLTPVSQRPLATDSVPPATPVNQVLTTIAVSPQNDNARVVGLRNGKVFATSTGSSTLANVTDPSFPAPNQGTIRRAVSRAIFNPNDQKTAYVTFGGYNVPNGHHIWKTTNLDTSSGAPAVAWTPSGFGIPDVPVNSITIDRLAPNNMYAATDIGIYRSSDAGASWSPFSNGLPRIAVFDIAFQEQAGSSTTDRILRIATHGRGIWEIAVPISPGQLTDVVSRKAHAAVNYDINLPAAGTPGIESRSGGANGEHTLIFTFANPLTSVADANVVEGVGAVSSSSIGADPRQYVVNLTGVANAQRLSVSLTGVVDTAGNSAAPVGVALDFLLADVNASRRVDSGDVFLVRQENGKAVTGVNFRNDVNASGRIDSGDVFLARRQNPSGLSQP